VAAVTPARIPRSHLVLESIPEPQDLLSRFREAFALPTTTDPAVERELAWYAQHPEYLDRVFVRGARYLHYITEELERRGMPVDLALLPVVESAFDPFAYSHGRASGLWQIIPGTGRRLGLKQNWWFDGRRDVIESTRAALDYLQSLHVQFGGDWLLAVAGYNSGEGNVMRALRRAQAAGEPADFWGIRRYLPVETRTYVPRLIAIRTLVAEPQAHGIVLPEVPNAPYFSIVETGGQIDMALAAELGALDLEQLYELNPGINRWATDPEGPHRLLVPQSQAATLTAALAALDARERMQWTRHEIRNGETLGQLAEKYHTTETVLREINGLRGNLIRAGGYLMVPHAMAAIDAYAQSASERALRQINRARSGERSSHVVKPGDSLWSIATAYEVNVRELAAWNAMAPGDILSVGREVIVWTNVSSVAATTTATADPDRPQIRRIDYVVRRGDSLSSIAGRFKVTVAKLLEWNVSASKEKYLQPGQRLVVYVDVTEQTA
jgi:membrane-bound lytic murein transglycosylase D